MSLPTKEDLKEKANFFKSEINRSFSILEEMFLILQDKSGNKQDYSHIIKMGIVYLLTYLELFNRDYFIDFLRSHPTILGKTEKLNKKDADKLTISYKDIATPDFGLNEDYLIYMMADNMYNKVFDYYDLGLNIFVSKFLDSFLELNFRAEAEKRQLTIIEDLVKFRDMRNKIVHGGAPEEYSIEALLKCKIAILDYINLVEELTIETKKEFDVKPTIIEFSFRGLQIGFLDAVVLEKIETLTEREFTKVDEIQYDTKMGVTFVDWHVTGIGLYQCELPNLPESIDNLKSLQTLNLQGNKLTTLPESITKLQSLQKLYLGDNKWTTLPESVKELERRGVTIYK